MTIGDTSIIKNFKDQELIDYYHKWYNPALMAVAVVGDINPKEVEKQIKKCFGDFVSQPIETYKTYGIDSYEDVSFRIVKDSSFNKTLFEILKVMPPLDPVVEESDYHKYLEKNIVSTLLKNRLTDLFYSSKPYFSAGMSISGFLNVSQIFYGKVELNPQKTDNGIDSYLKILNQIMTYGFTEDEIKKAKNKYAGILYSRSNAKNDRDSQKILDEIYNDFYSGHRIITASTEYKLFKKYADKIDSKSIMNYLKKINSYNSHYLLTTFQEELSNYNIDSIVTASLNEEVTPYEKKVNTPKELIKDFNKKGSVIRREKIAEIDADVLSLSNGAKIIYKQSDNDKDNTQISGFRKGGLFALDSANYINGLYCTSILSACGVGQYTREELDFYLTGKNISVRFLIDKTRSGVIASSSNRWITEMLQLMHLRWTQPRIDEKQFNLVKNKNINQIMESKRSAEDLFKEEVAIALQGNNYVTKTITEASIFENLQQDSIIPVFNQCFGNATDYCFIVVSSLPLSLLEPDLIKYIGALPFGKVRQDYQFKRYDFPEDSFTIESFSSDSPKGSVSLIYNQNRLPFELTEFNIKADIMKSVLRTRLLAELREKMGKVYSVGVAASGTVLPDTLCRETISFSCDPEDKDILTEKVAAVINEMIAEPQSMINIITDVKKNMVKTHLAEKQKSSFWSSSIRNAICFNYKNWDSVNNYEAMVEKISIEDIAEMMKHCFIESPCIKTYLLPKN